MDSVTAKQAKNAQQAAAPAEETVTEPQECFIIMPISDQPGYEPGHFTRVYRDIIVPACEMAGLKPCRADEDTSTNIIQHGILIKLLNAPVAICDLSSRNPNVMFELGLRQAFDKPVIIIQDEQTPAIFDISMLRYTSYRSGLLYHQVVEDQAKIASSIRSTVKDSEEGKSTNSLMKLLSIENAVLKDVDKGDVQSGLMESIQTQLSYIASRIESSSGQDLSRTERLIKRRQVIPISSEETYLHNILKNNDGMRLSFYSKVPAKLFTVFDTRVLGLTAAPFKDSLEAKEYFDLIEIFFRDAQRLLYIDEESNALKHQP